MIGRTCTISSTESQDVWKKWNIWKIVKTSLNVLLFIIAAVPVWGYYVYDLPAYKRGFFCNDESIVYPKKKSTISDDVLYDVGYTLPCLMIFFNELCEAVNRNYQSYQKFHLSKHSILNLVVKLYRRVGVFLFGAFINEIITNVSKMVIGRLRPCFMAICRPIVNCSSNSYPPTYILNYTCTNNDAAAVDDARKSFPSGHASFSFYTMVFLVMYFQRCVNLKMNKLLKPSFQTIFLMMAWFTALSRISNYKHHWGDITVGILLGTTIALGTVYFISDFGSTTTKKKADGDVECNDDETLQGRELR